MSPETHLIIVPGVRIPYKRPGLKKVFTGGSHRFEERGITTHLLSLKWWGALSSELFLEELTDMIDALSMQGAVALMGISMGSTLVTRAMALRPEHVCATIAVCPCLHLPMEMPRRLRMLNSISPAAVESINKLREIQLSPDLLQNLLVFRPRLDGAIPARWSTPEGANRKRLKAIGHWRGIKAAFREENVDTIVDFIYSRTSSGS